MSDLELVFEALPPEDLRQLINEGIDLHNVAATGVSEWYPVNFFLRSPRGEWLGGILGTTWGRWLHVKSLWVAACVRGRGHAERLMLAAESYAVERGCHAATLETHNPQAKRLYEKLGYVVFGKLEDYPPGHTKFFLRKRLTRSTANAGV